MFCGVTEYLAAQKVPADVHHQLQNTLAQINQLTILVGQLQ